MINLNTKLSKIQSEIGQVTKTQTNHYANFKYYQKKDIFNLIKPFLAKYNITISYTSNPEILNDMVIIKYNIILRDGDNDQSLMFSDFTILDTSQRKGKGSAEQVRGAADTYFWKYCLANIFLIPTSEKDADNTEQHVQYIINKTKDNKKPIEKVQNNLLNYYGKYPDKRQELVHHFKIENNKDNIAKLINEQTLEVAAFLNNEPTN